MMTASMDQADQLIVSSGSKLEGRRMQHNYSDFLAAHQQLVSKTSSKGNEDKDSLSKHKKRPVKRDVFGMAVEDGEDSDEEDRRNNDRAKHF